MGFGEDAGVPAGATLSVSEIPDDSDDYADYLSRVSDVLEAAGFAYARVFDIAIVDADGGTVQPLAPVDVTVELLDAGESMESFSVVHFAGATFILVDEQGKSIGTFTSDETGLITVAFLREDVAYTLTETKAPQGFHALEQPLRITLHGGTVSVSGADASDYLLSGVTGDDPLPTVAVIDRPFVFRAFKTDGDTELPVEGASFALHRQVTVDGVTTIDLNPMPGYESLVSGRDGAIAKLDSTLPAGTYELRETEAPEGYLPLESYVRFTLIRNVRLCADGEELPLADRVDPQDGYDRPRADRCVVCAVPRRGLR